MTSAASTTDPPYLAIAARKQALRSSLIPSKWRIPSDVMPHDPPRLQDGPRNVLAVPRQFLSKSELEITESYTVSTLLSAVASKKLSAVEVTEAFCHRAAIAHQLTNCLTEILFEQAIQRAKQLDEHLKRTGHVLGPLHGLPVSVKDTFNFKGVDSSAGLASLCFKPATSNAAMVDMLLSLGCVIISKTNIPQTLASLDSINHIFGRTMNPINRLCTAGGSSGGEGVMVAMRGSMIGIGTDVGGSIRIPAMCNGVYGFKPSQGRMPYGGHAQVDADGLARATIHAQAGPLARSVDDIEIFLRETIPRTSMWGEDCISGTWTGQKLVGSGEKGEVVIGVLRSDGNCALLPPIARIISEVAIKLKNTPNVRVVELETPKAWTKCQSLLGRLMNADGGEYMGHLLKETGEPLVPWMSTRFRVKKPNSISEVAGFQAQRSAIENEMMKLWFKQDSQGRRMRAVDAIMCPLAAHPVPEIEKYNAVGYTSSWVILDYPAAAVPVRDFKESDLELGKPFGGKVLGSWDKYNRELWDESKMDRQVYLGTPLSVQVVVPRLEDEKLVKVMELVDRAIKVEGSRSKL